MKSNTNGGVNGKRLIFRTLCVLILGIGLLGVASPGYAGTPVISNLSDFNSTEQDPAAVIDIDVTFSGGESYAGGYLEFALDGATSDDTLALEEDASASTTNGELSIVDGTLYLGDGSNAAVIGLVDSTDNGQNGQSLYISFSNEFENGSFEDGTNGSTVITGWTAVNEQISLNGTDQIADQNTPLDSTWPTNNGTIHDEVTFQSSEPTRSVYLEDEYQTGGDLAVRMDTGDIYISQGYGVMRGPYVYSDGAVSLQEGDTISFDWKALSGGDAYDAYGYIVDVNTGDIITILDQTGTSANQETDWETVEITIGSGEEGIYRFVFVAGSYDFTGYCYVGGELLIDDVTVTQAVSPPTVDDSIISEIARRVTFENTSNDPPATDRTLTVEAQAEDESIGSATATLTITPVNDAPEITSSAGTTATEDIAYTYTVSVTDPDSSIFTYSLSGEPTGMSVTDNVISWTPTEGVSSSGTVTLTVSDGDLTDTENFTISVTAVNDAPTDIVLSNTEIDVTGGVNWEVGTLSSTDVDSSSFTCSLVSGDGDGDNDLFAISGNVLTVNDANMAIGSYSVRIRTDDGDGGIFEESITLVVLDTDNDGIPDSFEGTGDVDGDGTPNYLDADSDGDGISDADEGTVDSDGDGTPNYLDTDSDGDGIFDADEGTGDVDGDGIPNYLDTDSDGDEIPDVEEGGNDVDTDGDGTPDYKDPDADGIDGTDGKDSDGDGVPDVTEIENGTDPHDGGDYKDSDGDGMPDNVELISGTDINDPDDYQLPVLTVPDDVWADATGVYTKVNLGVATAVDAFGKKLAVSLAEESFYFRPGTHTAHWQTEDRWGNQVQGEQMVYVRPMVSFSGDQTVVAGQDVTVTVSLNGTSPEYPVMVPYTVGGTAVNPGEHDLSSGTVTIASGTSEELPFTIGSGPFTEDKTVVITMDENVNRGAQYEFTATITDTNIAPVVELTVTQGGDVRRIVACDGGDVTVLSAIEDPNSGDGHAYDWSQTDAELVNTSGDSDSFVFDPSGVAPGAYTVALTVTDDNSAGSDVGPLGTTAMVHLNIVASLPELSGSDDSDGDGVSDSDEGDGDSDQDGIPDYLDAFSGNNEIPENLADEVGYLVETDPALGLVLGNLAMTSDSGGAQVYEDEMEADGTMDNVGGIFDYQMVGLPEHGGSYNVIIPQRLPIPDDAVYRKYTEDSGWVDFVEDDYNILRSAPGEPGFCPPAGSDDYVDGLVPDGWCVELTLEDGGPNDADGEVNGEILDPGGVAVAATGNTFPVASNDTATVLENSTSFIDVLANDIDADGDILALTSGASNMSGDTVEISGDYLGYTPADGFIGNALVTYGISDGNGGVDYAMVTVTVRSNEAPEAVDDSAVCDSNTAVRVDVLENDFDADGDELTLTGITLETDGSGSVSRSGGVVTFSPERGFSGTASVVYTISDGFGGTDQATMTIEVTMVENATVKTKGGGGAVSPLWLIMGFVLTAGAALRRRFRAFGVARALMMAVALTGLIMPSGAGAEDTSPWFGGMAVGRSDSHVDRAELNRELAASGYTAEIVSMDDSGTGYKLFVGRRFDHGLSVDLGYLNLGEVELTITGQYNDVEAFLDSVRHAYPLSAEGAFLAGSYNWYFYESFSALARAGIFSWDSDYRTTPVDGGATATDGQNGTDLFWGLGCQYDFMNVWSVQATWERFNLNGNDVDYFSAGVMYRFGLPLPF